MSYDVQSADSFSHKVQSLEILAMSEEMELLCERKLHSKAENILDISGVETRESLEG